MRKIKEALRLKFANGRSIRQISKSCDIGRSTAADYIGRAERAGLTWPLPADLDDKAIDRNVNRKLTPCDNRISLSAYNDWTLAKG